MPYTYLITFTNPITKEKKFYYGSRTAKDCSPDELGKTYFSSSEIIKNLLEVCDISCFEFEIRKIFDSREKALNWEHKVLRRMNAAFDKRFINRTDNRLNFNVYRTHEHNMRISEAKKGVTFSKEHKLALRGKGQGRVKKSEVHRERISNSRKGITFSEIHKARLAESKKDKHWITNKETGENKYVSKSFPLHHPWVHGRNIPEEDMRRMIHARILRSRIKD